MSQERTDSTINPYLVFQGNCQEAMEFYQEVFGGELDIMPFEGSPMEVLESAKKKVMHSTLTFGKCVVMASDDITPGDKPKDASNFSININALDIPIGEKWFNALAEGGKVKMPFQKTFWGAMFGMCTDKYGVNWMVNTPH